MHTLEVARLSPHGAYLTDGTNDVLLPTRYCPEGVEPGDTVRVFVHLDSDDRPIASTKRPAAVAGEFACLPVTAVTDVGAFVDWGLDKELLVPFREQPRRLEVGNVPVIRVVLDPVSGRLFGSARSRKYLEEPLDVQVGEPVDALATGIIPGGAKAIIDDRYEGAIFGPGDYKVGKRYRAYVSRIQEGRVQVQLQQVGYGAVEDAVEKILDAIRREGGFLALSDSSDPAEIQRKLGMSKGTFKKAIGGLLKQGRIETDKYGTRLLK